MTPCFAARRQRDADARIVNFTGGHEELADMGPVKELVEQTPAGARRRLVERSLLAVI